jgi:hypothetical protein
MVYRLEGIEGIEGIEGKAMPHVYALYLCTPYYALLAGGYAFFAMYACPIGTPCVHALCLCLVSGHSLLCTPLWAMMVYRLKEIKGKAMP